MQVECTQRRVIDSNEENDAIAQQLNTLSDVEKLPQEVLLQIFHLFEPREIGALASVCRTFNNLTNDRTIQKKLFLENIRVYEGAPQICCKYGEGLDYAYHFKPFLVRSGNFLVLFEALSKKLELFDIREKKHIRTIQTPVDSIASVYFKDNFLYLLLSSQGVVRLNIVDTMSDWSTILTAGKWAQDFHVFSDCIIVKKGLRFEGFDLTTQKSCFTYNHLYRHTSGCKFFGDFLMRYADEYPSNFSYYDEPITLLHPQRADILESGGCFPRCVAEGNLLLATKTNKEIMIFDLTSLKRINLVPIDTIIPELKDPLMLMDLYLDVLFLAEYKTLYVVNTINHTLIKKFDLQYTIVDLKVVEKQIYCATTHDLVLFDLSEAPVKKPQAPILPVREEVAIEPERADESVPLCELIFSSIQRIQDAVWSFFSGKSD